MNGLCGEATTGEFKASWLRTRAPDTKAPLALRLREAAAWWRLEGVDVDLVQKEPEVTLMSLVDALSRSSNEVDLRVGERRGSLALRCPGAVSERSRLGVEVKKGDLEVEEDEEEEDADMLAGAGLPKRLVGLSNMANEGSRGAKMSLDWSSSRDSR